jgi:hypothetical protein
MNEADVKALEFMAARHFDCWRLAGDANKAQRRYVMSLLTGQTLPYAKCGVTVIREELRRLVPVTGECEAARDADFEAKARAILAALVAA